MRINIEDLREHLLPNGWQLFASRIHKGIAMTIKTRGVNFQVTKHGEIIYEGMDIELAVTFFNSHTIEETNPPDPEKK